MRNGVCLGDLIKVIWWGEERSGNAGSSRPVDGSKERTPRALRGAEGACLFAKRLERGRFVWPSVADGRVVISAAQLAMLLEGIDWRAPVRTWRPLTVG